MTHFDDSGNVRVDFVWGNMAMQPDDQRDTPLDEELDSHEIAVYGWSNFPGFIPNYEGDGDSGLEAVVPDILRKTRDQAEELLYAVNLNRRFNDHYLTVQGLVSSGTTVRVFAYNTNAAGGGYPEAYLNGLREGDEVFIGYSEYDFGPKSVVTAVNEDGENSWFEVKVDTDPELETESSGTVYAAAGGNLENVITMMRGWNQPGDIRNEGTNIYARYFGLD